MKKIASVIFLLVITSITGWALLNRQWLRDVYNVQFADLQPQADKIKQKLDLTPDAGFIYNASRPEVQSAQAFNSSCANVKREQSIVLGCYTAQRFYVFDVNDPRLAGVKEVTAAHELLHAVYDRLSLSEQERINKLVNEAAGNITNQRFLDTMAQYQKTEPDQMANELHSILGTEIPDLPPDLEAHYARYFKDRKQIVAYAQQYESTFTSLEEQIKSYDKQLESLRSTKDALEASLDSLKNQIESEQNRLNQLRSSGNINAYNQAVPSFNSLVRTYNSDISQLKQVINDYNLIVEKRNGLATTQSNLVHELNSNYQTL